MEQLRKTLDAGWDPVELRERYNAAVAEKRAANTALASEPSAKALGREELEMYVDQSGDIESALDTAGPEEPSELYSTLRLSLAYDHRKQTADLEVDPLADRVDKYRVRGGYTHLNHTPGVASARSGLNTVTADLRLPCIAASAQNLLYVTDSAVATGSSVVIAGGPFDRPSDSSGSVER